MKINLFLVSLTFILLSACSQSDKESMDTSYSPDQQAILQIHQQYIEGWKKMDKEMVLSIFEDGARIQPNRLKPIEGIENMAEFWFPNDGSKTTINAFETEVVDIKVKDTLAIITYTSLLDWDYEKDTTHMGMVQNGVNTAVLRKQQINPGRSGGRCGQISDKKRSKSLIFFKVPLLLLFKKRNYLIIGLFRPELIRFW